MAYSPDGRELHSLGRFRPGVPPLSARLDIWVTGRREGGAGFGNRYLSFRTSDSGWGPAFSLDAANTPCHEFCPMMTPDGRYPFFSRMYGGGTWSTATGADVFWADVAAVERARR